MTDSNGSRTGPDRADETARGDADGSGGDELPVDAVDEAERLTRLARRATDDAESRAYERRRDDLLADHAFTARIRTDDGDDVLVLHPAEWHDDEAGVIRTERIEDTSRAFEVPLEGPGDPDDWDEIDAHNRELVERVRDDHGDVHGDNAAALADFGGNHYAKRLEELTDAELEEFRTDYFVRNAWPSAEQRAAIGESIVLVYETADTPVPGRSDR